MPIIKKIILIITIIIFLYILWQLILSRIAIKKQMIENTEGFSILSLFSSDKKKELSRVEETLNTKIVDANKLTLNLPLKDICIKASFNSAISGNFVNLDMLKYVINRGARYLDFEVFYIQPDNSGNFIPAVASSTDSKFGVLNTENYILLDNVLTTAVSSAFSPPCPNYNDPIFINLRIKSNNTDVYKAVAMSIDNVLKDKIYTDPNNTIYTDTLLGKTINKAKKVTKNTLLKHIKGHVIISVDKTIFPNYLNYTDCLDKDKKRTNPCYDLSNYINIQNGSNDMNLFLYNYLSPRTTYQIADDNIHTNAPNISVAIPDNLYLTNKSNSNLEYRDFILKYGCQIAPYRFYHPDDALENYEDFFNMNLSAFVPLANAISYYMNQKDNEITSIH